MFDLEFVQITVTDWAHSCAWYRNVLGLSVLLVDPEAEFCLFDCGRGRLGIRGGEGETRDRSLVGLVLRVEDLDAARDRLIARGVEVSPIRTNAKEAYRDAKFTDREGTPITIFSWDDPSQTATSGRT